MKNGTYSESELKEKAQEVFKQFPNAKEVYATSDGNVFLMENRAKLHAGKGNVLKVQRDFEAAKEEETFNLDALKKADLVEFAKVNNIDLGGLTEKNSKPELLDAISKALEEKGETQTDKTQE